MSGHGRIVRLEVENFKSYKGRQIIGPFHDFTCIIGPNGAGKSNLMDAISFVVGLRAAFLRSSNLKQLIYNADGQSAAARRTAFAELVFRTKDDEEIHFKRTIANDGTSQYYINDSAVAATKYEKRLAKYGILTKARNFLVFQGDVESIANKSPADLTKLFEQVSGSDEFLSEYNRLKEENDKINDLVVTNLQKKKMTSVERSKFKAQKKEASKYDEKVSEHVELQTTYILWKLYHIEKKISSAVKEKKDIDREIKKLQDKLKTTQNELKERKKEYAQLRKDNNKLSDEVKTFQTNKSKKTVARDKLVVRINHIEEEIKKMETRVDERTTESDRMQSEISQLQEELTAVEKEERDFEERIAREKNERGEIEELGDEQSREYLQLKNTAGVETVTLQQRLTTIQAERNSLEEQLKSFTQKREELTTRRKQLTESIEHGLQPRLKRLQDTVATSEKIHDQKTVQLNRERTNQDNRKGEKDSLSHKLEEISDKLRDARVDKKASEREERFSDAVESMQRLFTGVHGKLRDLCTVSLNRYNVAVYVAMGGRNANAIIVDTEKVALDCIEYLKEQRVSVATFIPLDTIKAKKISERLRSQLSQEKLVVDVLSYDKQYEKAFRYAIGNTVVCDTLDNAMKLCFDRNLGERIKAVTLDGTVISKSGMITGGLADAMGQSAKPAIKEKDVDKLKSSRDDTLIKLQELARDEVAAAQTVQKLEQDLAHLENLIKYTKLDIEFTEKKIESTQTDIDQINDHLKVDEPQISSLSSSKKDLISQQEEIEGQVREIEDRIFGDFSRRLGIANIREYENELLKLEQETTSERARFQLLKSRINQKLNYSRRRLADLTGVSSSEALKQNEEKLAKNNEDLSAAEKELSSMEKEEKTFRSRQNDMKKKLNDKHTEINELNNIEQEQFSELQKLEKQATTKDNFIERNRNERRELFMKCRVEEIELPTLEEPIEEEPSRKRQRTSSGGKQPSSTRKRKRSTRSSTAEEEMSDEEEQESLQSSEPFSVSQQEEATPGSQVTREREEIVRLDFSELDKKILKDDQYDTIDEQFQDDLQQLVIEIDQLAPSVGAVGRMGTVTKKYEETFEEYKQAKKKQKEIQQQFNDIKKKRLDTFMKAFEPISQVVPEIYKELTRSDEVAGGSAYLGLLDTDEPYLHGLKYNTIPPAKRYREMEQLSGGEKTVAALALLFAIHKYRPSPFFILDEIDAALDSVNVQKVANYLLNHKVDCQFIVISLKESFFTLGDCLVGIYRDQPSKSSGLLTLDMQQFGAPAVQSATETPRYTRTPQTRDEEEEE